MNDDMLIVATLGKSVGLKGYIRLHNKSDFISQFKKGANFICDGGLNLTIKHFDLGRSCILFEGFDDLDLAKTLTNKNLYTTKELTRKNCKLKKDEYFYFDVIGLKVVENGEILGIVSDIMDMSANYLFLVKVDDRLVNNGLVSEFYLPYVDRYILDISLQSGQIIAKDAKELLESL
ncbi:ribosome maturation factor RimM [Campylobacter sp. 19-13652]|uniref:ribosome maturation factor RimM n=1 Tax=Campylobacter sp. 19-13652 TaxID=2840180 RepID=UPI001C77D658|nr:ribosome maturation factor RimM [Campylobacter sp. 19-13652]BCX79372.1 ribosome maturation factor RimM [Campylobacter sp. 19-13652]